MKPKRLKHPPPLSDVRPPKISAALKAVVRNCTREVFAADVQRVVLAIRSAVRDYDRSPEAIEDLRHSVGFNMTLWYQALLTGQAPSPALLADAAASGRRRVHQEVSLPGLLRAYRLGSREIWSVLLDATRRNRTLHEELLFKLSPYLLFHFDLVAQTVAQAYTVEQHRRTRWQDRLRHDLCAVIFTHPERLDDFRAHTQALGLDAGAAHAVLALQLDERLGSLSEFDERLDALLTVLTRLVRPGREPMLHTVRNGHLLFWMPLPRGETLLGHERRLSKLASNALDAQPKDLAAAGIGLCGNGPRGWQLSAQQAIKAIELGSRLGARRAAHRYADVALDDAVMNSQETAHYFDTLLDRLSAEVGLIETLAEYFDHGQQRKTVAAKLGVHPNTLDYRLHRIELLLGVPLSDTGWLVKLHTALRLRRLRKAAV